MMTPELFRQITGSDPKDDDLERCNCPQAGQRGHQFCGGCPVCGMPRFMGCDCAKVGRKKISIG